MSSQPTRIDRPSINVQQQPRAYLVPFPR